MNVVKGFGGRSKNPKGGIATGVVRMEEKPSPYHAILRPDHQNAETVTKKCAALKQNANLFEIRIPVIDDIPDTVVV